MLCASLSLRLSVEPVIEINNVSFTQRHRDTELPRALSFDVE